MFEHGAHRHGRSIAERANRTAHDVFADRVEQFQVTLAALSFVDAIDDAP
jgi:hypothetical protein